MQAAARQERDEDRVHRRGLVRADEEPVAAADDLAAELELARVVVERQPPVVEEPLQRRALIARVADRLGERALVEDAVDQAVAPREESRDDRAGLLLADGVARRGRGGRDLAFELEERADHRQRFARPLGLRAERLVEVAPGVREAADFDDPPVGEEVVVDGMGVGDEVALVAGEELDRPPAGKGRVERGSLATRWTRTPVASVQRTGWRKASARIASTTGRASGASSSCQPQTVERASSTPSRA